MQSPLHFQSTPSFANLNHLKHKLEIFFLMITTHLQHKTPLTIAVIDLEKTSKYNFDQGHYSLPESSEYFHYTEYTLSSHSHKNLSALIQLKIFIAGAMLYGIDAIYNGTLLRGTICSLEYCPFGISNPERKHICAILFSYFVNPCNIF